MAVVVKPLAPESAEIRSFKEALEKSYKANQEKYSAQVRIVSPIVRRTTQSCISWRTRPMPTPRRSLRRRRRKLTPLRTHTVFRT